MSVTLDAKYGGRGTNDEVSIKTPRSDPTVPAFRSFSVPQFLSSPVPQSRSPAVPDNYM